MICHLKRHPDVLGAAGRDLLQDHPEMRRTEPRILDVGRLHWFGRITGNQYRGGGKPRKVDVLRGSNCLFRGAFLRGAGLDEILRGQGAQVHWEVALALPVGRVNVSFMIRKSRLFTTSRRDWTPIRFIAVVSAMTRRSISPLMKPLSF